MFDINKAYLSYLKEYSMIFLGVFFLAFAIDVFFLPNNMVTGGISGIAIIIQSLGEEYLSINIPLSLTNTILNIPLFLLGIYVFSFRIIMKSLFATMSLSLCLFVMEEQATSVYVSVISSVFHTQGDLFLSAIFGGVFAGFGLGLVFRYLATTGGTDLLASIIHQKVKHISVSNLLFILDAVIIIVGLLVFDAVTAMYSVISVFVCSKVITMVLDGLSFAKAAWIISDKVELITKYISTEIDRGSTLIKAKGSYTGKDKEILLCVVSPKQVSLLKTCIKEIDPEAFVIVSDVKEVLGLGFRELI